MKFILKNEINKVTQTKQIYNAASALEQHRSLVAKAKINRLLISKKGLLVAFSAGVAQGAIGGSTSSAQSGMVSLVRKLLPLWLAAQEP